MTAFLRRDASILAISVVAAFITRFFVLVAGRPDFVGWFNHSAYFWVQSKSLLVAGSLAYGDMPLLFALYAGLAKCMGLVGVPLEPSIILASRLVMTVVPALIPISVYGIAKIAAGENRLDWPARCLIFASGFLPLTFANMPEHLQKNMMGLLLLAFSFFVLAQWFRSGRTWQLLLLLLLLVAICLTHLGSALAALLLVAALTIDYVLRRASLRELVRVVLLPAVVVAAVGTGIRFFDPAAADRVGALIAELIPADTNDILVSILVAAIWLGLLLALWRWFARHTTGASAAVATLGRAVILWIGLLAMPLWPGEIGIRLLLFVPLGAVILLMVVLSMFRQVRLFRYVAAAATLACALMSIGETVSLLMIYPDKAKTSEQLAAVAGKYELSQNDLVITPYGANAIANWFLGTKGSLVTAVQRDMATQYERVFVLNTLERRAPGLEPGECRLIRSEDERYWATRHDTPMGEGSMPDPDYDMFAFYRLEVLPSVWIFDNEGIWAGWGDCS